MDRGGRRGNSEANSDGKAPLPIAEAARDGAKTRRCAGEARAGYRSARTAPRRKGRAGTSAEVHGDSSWLCASGR